MAGVFISYRRDDSQGFAGRLADDLTEILGAERVFRDVEIPVGQDFTVVLNRAVAASDVLLVVIGRNWHAPLEPQGKSRLFAPADWVRAEIEAAFDLGIPVVPILVGGARMCAAPDLPDSISRLAKIQAFVMSDRNWDGEIMTLVDLLYEMVPSLESPSRRDADTVTPAQVLRELGHRLFDEIGKQRNRNTPQSPPVHIPRAGSLPWFRGLLRKALTLVAVVAVIYIGLLLFGDKELLLLLDRFEARLEIGWERLLSYIESVANNQDIPGPNH